MNTVRIYDAGLVEYAEGLSIQEQMAALVASGKEKGVLVLCSHPSVITLGRGGGHENLLVSEAQFAENGIGLFESARGGNVTCHNPGQLVAYPILDLTQWEKDAHLYLRNLEEVVIRTLAAFGLATGRKEGLTGVWAADEKICAMGISLKHWITGHGLALNIENDLSLFSMVVPCGISDYAVTSMRKAGSKASFDDVVKCFCHEFEQVFSCLLTSDRHEEEPSLENVLPHSKDHVTIENR